MLNKHRIDPLNLKVLIVSTPKTGNTWLKTLLHYAYGLPIVELPDLFDDASYEEAGSRWVTHKHNLPQIDQLRWVHRQGVVVISTARHPGDILVSLFHHMKWSGELTDPAKRCLCADVNGMGSGTREYIGSYFGALCAVTPSWADLGALVVRYEDLLSDPLGQLRKLTSRIQPVDEACLQRAVVLCAPDLFRVSGKVDPRHVRSAATGDWRQEIPSDLLPLLQEKGAIKDVCNRFGYDWDADASIAPPFDYSTISPFAGRREFDNGEPLSPLLANFYLADIPDAIQRWPDPTRTAGDSFWAWLNAPNPAAQLDPAFPSQTLTNLMTCLYRLRGDIRDAFRDPVGPDRLAFAQWFVTQATNDYRLPWGLILPVQQAINQHIVASMLPPGPAPGRITSIVVANAAGAEQRAFGSGEDLAVTIQFDLDEAVDRPVIGFSLRSPINGFQAASPAGGFAFGTNTTQLGCPIGPLPSGKGYRVSIRSAMTLPAGNYLVSVGVACFDMTGCAVPIDRRFDQVQISVGSPGSSFGTAWCPTTMSFQAPG